MWCRRGRGVSEVSEGFEAGKGCERQRLSGPKAGAGSRATLNKKVSTCEDVRTCWGVVGRAREFMVCSDPETPGTEERKLRGSDLTKKTETHAPQRNLLSRLSASGCGRNCAHEE